MYKEIRKKLFELSEPSIKILTCKLSPDIDAEYVYGIRVPKLRDFAKKMVKEENWEKYVNEIIALKESYFEEIQLAGLLIGYSKIDLDQKLDMLKKYIPLMNSWAVTDTICPTLKIKEKDLEKVWKFILLYINSEKEFEARFSIIMMLDYYINDEYVDKVIDQLNSVKNDAYYVKMAIAWTLAEIGIKYYSKLIEYMNSKENNLDKFTYNKTLQKMRESYRIGDIQKDELKKMKK